MTHTLQINISAPPAHVRGMIERIVFAKAHPRAVKAPEKAKVVSPPLPEIIPLPDPPKPVLDMTPAPETSRRPVRVLR